MFNRFRSRIRNAATRIKYRARKMVGRAKAKVYNRARPSAIVNYYAGNMARTGVPSAMRSQLKTVLNVDPSGAFTYKTYALKINSVNDPMGDAAAVQPIGYDQLKGLYQHCIVLSGAYKITFTNTGSAPVTVACYTSARTVVGGASAAALVNNFGGQPGAKYRVASGTGSGSTVAIISRSFKVQQIVGPLDRSSHGAEVDHDPTGLAYLYVLVAAASGNVSGNMTIEAVQNTQFYDKVNTVD